MRELRLTAKSRWIFDLFADYGMRDGFAVPVGPWALYYWSNKPLRLSPATRADLVTAAVAAMEQFAKITAKKRRTGSTGSTGSEETRVHHAARRRGGCVTACGG